MAKEVREIMTKAIISKGMKKTSNKYSFPLEGISKILGCWISNNHAKAYIEDGKPIIEGCYDIHIWYSNNNEDSHLSKNTITYKEYMDVKKKELRAFNDEDQFLVDNGVMPKCINAMIENENAVIEIKKELSIKIVGNTFIRVHAIDDNETWDENIDIEINENFIT